MSDLLEWVRTSPARFVMVLAAWVPGGHCHVLAEVLDWRFDPPEATEASGWAPAPLFAVPGVGEVVEVEAMNLETGERAPLAVVKVVEVSAAFVQAPLGMN